MCFQFQTPRLVLRPWTPDDRPALARMAGDTQMMRYVTQGRTWSDPEIDEFLARQRRHLARHGICFGAAELRAGGEVIGVAGMQPHDDGQFELGWWIWKDYWGCGYATEAMQPFVEHAREVMRLECVVAIIDPPNLASRRVAEKLGFRYRCTKSARETVATRDDIPIDYFRLDLANVSSA